MVLVELLLGGNLLLVTDGEAMILPQVLALMLVLAIGEQLVATIADQADIFQSLW